MTQLRIAPIRLLDDSPRTDVWPDSVQVIGGQLFIRLPTGWSGVALFEGIPLGHARCPAAEG
jgi:hypothetical protein